MTDLIDQYRQMHTQGKFRGESLRPHLDVIEHLIRENHSKSVLDYGCGKAELYTSMSLPTRWDVYVKLYDPACPPHDKRPMGRFDGVICTDVMEHIPQSEIGMTLDDILGFARQWAFFSVCTRKAKKNLPDGRNAHLTVKPIGWWDARIAEAKLRLGRPLTVKVAYTE